MKSINQLLNFSIINLDKPKGPTSFQVSQYIKNSLNLNKTSHMGTLDPAVTGVLPITLGRACRLAPFLMHRDKTYVGILRLHKENVSDSKLKKAMEKYTGKIIQLPPKKSAVKRQEREREVKSFKIIERNGKDVLFEAEVEAGTYIRRLCDDVGKELEGAHMLELRRTQAGLFKETDTTFLNLYDFERAINENILQKYLIPAEEAIKSLLPSIQANPDSISKLLTGKPIYKNDLFSEPKEKTFALFNKNDFIGIYTKTNEEDIIARPDFVYN